MLFCSYGSTLRFTKLKKKKKISTKTGAGLRRHILMYHIILAWRMFALTYKFPGQAPHHLLALDLFPHA